MKYSLLKTLTCLGLVVALQFVTQSILAATVLRIGNGGAYGGSTNNVNSVSFRTDPLVTHDNSQYASYYDPGKKLILAKRTIGSTNWTTTNTLLTAEISDSHRAISMAVDGNNYVHVSWGHHAEPFNYVRSVAPGSLYMSGKLSMQNLSWNDNSIQLTYPEFFYLPDGNLLFTYRLGGSGSGDTYIQRYNKSNQTWTRLHNPTIRGRTGGQPGDVNAYPNGMVLDFQNRLHWTWTWREYWDGTKENRDQLYVRSTDLGNTWTTITGGAVTLPIHTNTPGILARAIPLDSDIANNCHMAVDMNDRPMIVQRWDPDGAGVGVSPRVILTWHNGSTWQTNHVTGSIGWTRPLVLVDSYNRVMVFYAQTNVLKCAYTPNQADRSTWAHTNLASYFLGGDVVFDRKRYEYGDGRINIFLQNAISTSVNVVEWDGLSPERGPIADAHVRTGTYANTNFGTNNVLEVKLDPNADFTRETFLRFDVSGLANASSIKLKVVPVSLGPDANTTTVEYRFVGSDTWTESGVTWNNKPGSSELLFSQTGGFTVGVPIEIDVTAKAKAEASTGNGLFSVRILSLTSGSSRSINFGSRQHANLNYLPLLKYQ